MLDDEFWIRAVQRTEIAEFSYVAILWSKSFFSILYTVLMLDLLSHHLLLKQRFRKECLVFCRIIEFI